MITISDILKLTKQLFPTGRAWKIPFNSVFEKFIKGLGQSEVRAYNFAVSTLDRILPDNPNFTAEDATVWERRLGLPVQSVFISLTTRKAIIERKLQYPGNFLNRQNYRYIEAQLQLAGFDVTVTENTDPLLEIGTIFQHGYQSQMGFHTEMGSIEVDIIANSAFRGESFTIATPLDVFIISGNIPENLITTFRKLVLLLKPVNTAAWLNVVYTKPGDLAAVAGFNLIAVNGSNLVMVKYV